MVEAGERRLNKVLVVLLSILVLVVLGLAIWILVVKIQGEDKVVIPKEDWGTVVGECMFDFNTTAVDCSSFQNELKSIVETSGDENEVVMAGIDLSALYAESDVNAAIDLLEGIFNDNMSDQNKYYVLKTLLVYYEKNGDENKYVEKLREIVGLPDSMKLEREDWGMAKRMFVYELEEIENGEVDNGLQ
ncbi:hypothetical protein IJJ36_01375 [Candidatus Saccharibacteria bacterium]|nr:hypothetical protein [Candidatus Saccharibacteria bacterium]